MFSLAVVLQRGFSLNSCDIYQAVGDRVPASSLSALSSLHVAVSDRPLLLPLDCWEGCSQKKRQIFTDDD